MSCMASIELRGLSLKTQIGSYQEGDIIPDEHLLDLTLFIDSNLVLISQDKMEHVFDYDPLVVEIEQLAIDGHYETQERLMTRIVQACASYPQIQSLEISLRKTPVLNASGSLGVRLSVGKEDLSYMRN